MPIRDTDAMNRSLDNDYGPTAGPNSPATWSLGLFAGDPMIPINEGGGVEANADVDHACPGYARVTISQSDFAPAADGSKKLVTPAQFPDSAAEWDVTITHWALMDPVSGVMWDCAPLADDLDITAAAPGPLLDIAIFYDDSVVDTTE